MQTTSATKGQIGSFAPFDQFTAIPGKNDPKELFTRYQFRLKESILVYVKKIGDSLQISLATLLDKINHLNPERRFSPEIFSIYVRLRDAYPKKDLHALFDTLQALRNLQESHFYVLNREYGTILTESWETSFVDDMRNSHPTDEEGERLTKQIRILPLVHWEPNNFPPPHLVEAERLISELDQDLWREFETYVSKIKLFSGRVMEGVTSARFFGNIYLRLPHPEEDPVLFYFEHVIHEASHLHLYAMMGEDPIVLNEESERYPSPLRVDKRPMNGIFHAAFVLARIIRALKRLHHHSPENSKACSILKNCEKLFLDGLETIDKYARLTQSGKSIFLTMEPCAFE